MDKDLYTILGLKADASPQLIKKAYRKLVGQFHPDRYQHHSEEERLRVNERMVEITEAFRVLGNETERASYDKKRAEEQAAARMAREQAVAKMARGAATTAPHGGARAASAPATAGQAQLHRDMAQDFLAKLFAQLKSAREGVQWSEEPSESRDWTRCLRAGEFGATYFLQVYQTRDATPSLARQFVRNAEAFVKSQKSVWRNSYFIFVLAFQKLTSTDEVMAVCNKFERIGKSGPLTEWRAVIVLLDARNMRSVFCGRTIPVESLQRTFQVLQGKW